MFQIALRTYTWNDVYEIMIIRLLRRKLYAWYNAYRKKENTKVRNYNLRDWDSEMNMKVLK